MERGYKSLFFPLGCLNFGCLLSLFVSLFLVGVLGVPWLANALLLFFFLLLVSPLLVFAVLRWWVNKNVIEGHCPSCDYRFFAFKSSTFSCPNCGESLLLEGDKFVRQTPPGTVEVEAVEVSVEDSSS